LTDPDPLTPSDVAPPWRPPGPPPEVSPEALLAAVRACVTVVGPGEVLAVRIPPGWAADRGWQDVAARLHREQGVRVVFLPGEEFAVIRPKEE
jgi:hypothetical protein